MTISSRTPEGTPNYCPVCGAGVCVEPSSGSWDAPCPACGYLLWFPEPGGRPPRSVSYQAIILRIGRDRFGPLPVALKRRLLIAIRTLARRERLPNLRERVAIVMEARNWRGVVRRFEARASRWAAVVEYVRGGISRAFAKRRA